MSFTLPKYHGPSFSVEPFLSAPNVVMKQVVIKGSAPDGYHAMSIYPEYFKIDGNWLLAYESRMDCVPVYQEGMVQVVEFRNLKVGDWVILGRSEDASEGVYMHTTGFYDSNGNSKENFSFRSSRSRETAYSKDYDELYELLKYEKAHNGYVVWVLGPAVSFDHDAREAVSSLVKKGYIQALLAGNALATHDLEGAYLGSALGQDIYTQESYVNGHYNHLDLLNKVRMHGSIEKFIQGENIEEGIISACVKHKVPFVLAGSIRDDGPLPEVYGNVYEAQDAMRVHARQATTLICLATQLHTIATGNMTPAYILKDDVVRNVFIYCVDVSEFVVNKLRDRGSLEVKTLITNVQDFVTQLDRNL